MGGRLGRRCRHRAVNSCLGSCELTTPATAPFRDVPLSRDLSVCAVFAVVCSVASPDHGGDLALCHTHTAL